MRHLTTIAILPLIVLTILPAQAQMVTITPEQIGQIFCIGSLGNDMAPVEALLAPELSSVLVEAYAASAAFEIEHPGDKPPMGDGVPWRSWPDYADGCAVTAGTAEADRATVTINYSFAAAPAANYSDTLQLKPVVVEDGMQPFWRIDDIALAEGYSLRQALAAAVKP